MLLGFWVSTMEGELPARSKASVVSTGMPPEALLGFPTSVNAVMLTRSACDCSNCRSLLKDRSSVGVQSSLAVNISVE